MRLCGCRLEHCASAFPSIYESEDGRQEAFDLKPQRLALLPIALDQARFVPWRKALSLAMVGGS